MSRITSDPIGAEAGAREEVATAERRREGDAGREPSSRAVVVQNPATGETLASVPETAQHIAAGNGP